MSKFTIKEMEEWTARQLLIKVIAREMKSTNDFTPKGQMLNRLWYMVGDKKSLDQQIQLTSKKSEDLKDENLSNWYPEKLLIEMAEEGLSNYEAIERINNYTQNMAEELYKYYEVKE